MENSVVNELLENFDTTQLREELSAISQEQIIEKLESLKDDNESILKYILAVLDSEQQLDEVYEHIRNNYDHVTKMIELNNN